MFLCILNDILFCILFNNNSLGWNIIVCNKFIIWVCILFSWCGFNCNSDWICSVFVSGLMCCVMVFLDMLVWYNSGNVILL